MTAAVSLAAIHTGKDVPQTARCPAWIDGPWIDGALVLLAAVAFFATPLQLLRLVGKPDETARIGLAFAVAASLVWLVWRQSAMLAGIARRVVALTGWLRLWQIAIVGLLLRLAWYAVFPAHAGSDGAIYLELAQKLAAGKPYEIAGTRAYWPVGYPLFLTPWIAMIGPRPMLWLLANAILFLTCLTGVAALAHSLAGDKAGKTAALLVALWPNLVASTATPEKELLVVALLPWVAFFVVQALHNVAPLRSAVGAGLLLGVATLVQPSLQFVAPIVAMLLMASLPWRRGAAAGLLLCLAAAVVIAPWTVRNHAVFGRFVLVSTNGGDNFYRANNPLATGAYAPGGAEDLSMLGEIERDAVGKHLALAWIRSEPTAFAKLVPQKQVFFMGDDATGVYTTLKVGGAAASNAVYALLKAAANAWWLLAWIVLAALVIDGQRHGNPLTPLTRLMAWPWFYLFTLHSVFESAGKYHLPVLWALAVLIAVRAAAADRQTLTVIATPRSEKT